MIYNSFTFDKINELIQMKNKEITNLVLFMVDSLADFGSNPSEYANQLISQKFLNVLFNFLIIEGHSTKCTIFQCIETLLESGDIELLEPYFLDNGFYNILFEVIKNGSEKIALQGLQLFETILETFDDFESDTKTSKIVCMISDDNILSDKILSMQFQENSSLHVYNKLCQLIQNYFEFEDYEE